MKLDSHTNMIASIKEDVEVMKIDIKEIKSELMQKADTERFEILENRVAILEMRVEKLRI